MDLLRTHQVDPVHESPRKRMYGFFTHGTVNENAFVSEVQTRPCPTFGRPVHPGFPHRITARYFSSCPSDSISRWTPCPPKYKQFGLGCIRLSPSYPFRRLHTFHLLRPRGCEPR